MLSRLQYFPIGFFSAIMGLAGFAIASQKLNFILLSHIVFGLGFILFLLFCLAYLYKIFTFRAAVISEFENPITLNFFPAFSMAMLLLSSLMQEFSMMASFVMWTIATGVQFALTLAIFSRWVHSEIFNTNHVTPVWFLPLVGNLLIPITGISHAHPEFLWFFYSFGTFFWLLILTIFLNRIFFHDPLPEKLSPTFFILLAPPSLVVLSSFALDVEGFFPKMAYYIGLFILLLLISQGKKIVPKEFFISWWAFSFPLAAFTSASFAMYSHFSLIGFWWISFGCYALLCAIIIILSLKTAKAIWYGEICKGH